MYVGSPKRRMFATTSFRSVHFVEVLAICSVIDFLCLVLDDKKTLMGLNPFERRTSLTIIGTNVHVESLGVSYSVFFQVTSLLRYIFLWYEYEVCCEKKAHARIIFLCRLHGKLKMHINLFGIHPVRHYSNG